MTEHASPSLSLIERSVENLVTVGGAVVPSVGRRGVHSSAPDAFVALSALMAAVALALGLNASLVDPSSASVIAALGVALVGIACATALAYVARRDIAVPPVAVGLLWAAALGGVLAGLLAARMPEVAWGMFLAVCGGAALAPVALFLISRYGPITGFAASLAFALPPALVTLQAIAPEEELAYRPLPDTEAVYGVQPLLMDRETVELRPGVPGVTELFAVLGAGYPYEGVFERELQAVDALLSDQFDAEDRIVRLANLEDDPTRYPLLNRTNLTAAIARVSAAMNRDEDLLLLFLTSHGNTGILSTEFDGVSTRNLTPRDVADALDASDVSNAIVIISACYSGSFVDELAGPGRLILTAAAADRNSFGCNDENEWTEWGRAFFVDAWAHEPDPRVAVREALRLVAEREAEQELTPSLPQVVEGALIGSVIDNWLDDLSRR